MSISRVTYQTVVLVMNILLLAPHCSFSYHFRLERVGKSSSTPAPRAKASLTSLGTRAILFGGRGDSDVHGDSWTYDGRTERWTQLRNISMPTPRYDALCSTIVLGQNRTSFAILIGGRNETGILKSSLVWIFDFRTDAWSEVEIYKPFKDHGDANLLARAGASGGASNDNSFIISHGYDGSTILSDTHEIVFQSQNRAYIRQIYNPIGQFALGDPHPLCNASSVITGANELIMYGGCYMYGMCPSRDTWAFDLTSREWRQLESGAALVSESTMSNALPSFQRIDMDPRQTVVVWGGEANSPELFRFGDSIGDGLDISLLDVRQNKWIHERIMNGGEKPIANRYGTSMAPIITNIATGEMKYLMIGGVINNNGTIVSDSMLLSFDPSGRLVENSDIQNFFSSKLTIHGILMFVAFCVILPSTTMVSRYLKLYLNKKIWFVIHWIPAVIAFVLAWIGQTFAFHGKTRERASAHFHYGLGMLVLVLISAQVLLSMPGIKPAPDGSRRRNVWKHVHDGVGWTVILAGMMNSFLGMILLVAPVGIWLGLVITSAVLFGAVMLLEALRCCYLDRVEDKGEVPTEYGKLK